MLHDIAIYIAWWKYHNKVSYLTLSTKQHPMLLLRSASLHVRALQEIAVTTQTYYKLCILEITISKNGNILKNNW